MFFFYGSSGPTAVTVSRLSCLVILVEKAERGGATIDGRVGKKGETGLGFVFLLFTQFGSIFSQLASLIFSIYPPTVPV